MMGCKGFFDNFPELPVWGSTDTETFCTDAKTGKELARHKIPHLPNGEQMEIMKDYDVVILKDIIVDDRTGKKVKSGSKGIVTPMPHGDFYLAEKDNPITVICVEAIEGEDFKFV